MRRRLTYTFLFLLLASTTLLAQEGRDKNILRALSHGWTFELRAGVALGGAAPYGLPVEIREIEGYNPKLNAQVEGLATKMLDPHWGVSMGLRLEQKGMKTQARVKNYHTSILLGEEGQMAGYFTGHVETDYDASSLVIPISAVYKVNDAGRIRAGFYAGYRFDGTFSGSVSDGYFRNGTPVGEKIIFAEDQKSTFDFSDELSRFEAGMQVGGSWHAYKHFLVYAELRASFTPIFPNSFSTIPMNLYPVYVSTGFSYLF